MYVTRFSDNFKALRVALKPCNFSESELNKIALEGAMKLEELAFKDRELSLMEEKSRQEIEIATLKAKSERETLQAQALSSVAQAETMLLAVRDNALINKLNAYNTMINILCNAADSKQATASDKGQNSHIDNILEIIAKIGADGISNEYLGEGGIIPNTLEAIGKISEIKNTAREVFIYTPRLEITKNERVKLYGFSIFGNKQARFRYAPAELGIEIDNEKGEILESKLLLFCSEEVGFYDIIFEAQNEAKQWIGDKIRIEVRE